MAKVVKHKLKSGKIRYCADYIHPIEKKRKRIYFTKRKDAKLEISRIEEMSNQLRRGEHVSMVPTNITLGDVLKDFEEWCIDDPNNGIDVWQNKRRAHIEFNHA